ncbi:MAG: aspartate kinase [Candidatus Desulforudaceae bacterium]|nr:aspartate kinase [Bacillota bacterium]MBV1727405.1 aspartate kinase [Desulforudis sp.]MDP3051560.1 aspartate kinase [Eubacteriales bacterium]MDQ7789347.1 aspartate kinase [Clostridia bacterium]MBU4532879.1 aspartate kinase [Bacillota bacterium]
MRFVIQKFGGTSVKDAGLRSRVVDKVVGAKDSGLQPVVVVSALGRYPDPYATDSLLELVRGATGSVNARDLDLLLACGEIISGVIVAGAIRERGRPTVFLTGSQAGIITNGTHGEARILRVETDSIRRFSRSGHVVVVAGFQGISEDGEVTTLGRGGSDTTAAALGVALSAESIDIYTDVEGVMTADPRIISEAKPIECLSYNEVCHLAHEGARVIHPRAVEIAMQRNIPVWIKSTLTDAPGTLITNHIDAVHGTLDIPSDRVITGVTYRSGLVQVRLHEKGAEAKKEALKALALAGISLDLINYYPDLVAFSVKGRAGRQVASVLESLGVQFEMESGCAKVAVVGAGMAGVPGVMARIVETLDEQDVEILQTADSHTTIWVLVRESDLHKSVRALYDAFGLGDYS